MDFRSPKPCRKQQQIFMVLLTVNIISILSPKHPPRSSKKLLASGLFGWGATKASCSASWYLPHWVAQWLVRQVPIVSFSIFQLCRDIYRDIRAQSRHDFGHFGSFRSISNRNAMCWSDIRHAAAWPRSCLVPVWYERGQTSKLPPTEGINSPLVGQ